MSKSKEKPTKKNKSGEKPERTRSSATMEEFRPTSSFVNFLMKRNMEPSSAGKPQLLMKPDFKLNPTALIKIDEGALKLSEVPLQSLDEGQPLSITKMRDRQRVAEAETVLKKTKKYNIDLTNIGGGQGLRRAVDPMDIEQDEKLIRPSEIYELPSPRAGRHCIFQTPMLPNFQQGKLERPEKSDPVEKFFQQEYDSCGNEVTENYKTLAKEGVYKIGKIKIKGKRAELTIGDIKMEACLGYGEGRAVAVASDNMYEVGDWSGMWIVQPTAQLFE